MKEKQDIYVGCLLGGAVGDALGYAVEFYEDEAIFRKYGEKGICKYELYQGVAEISDDTQMTLFTAEGLLSRTAATDPVRALHKAYLDWYKTQTASTPLADGGLLSIRELYSSRAPGNTCLNALERGICGTLERPINRSKGCGGIMRVAPVALYGYRRGMSVEATDVLAARAAAITHGHELGYIPAAMLVHILYRILEGRELLSAVEDALSAASRIFPDSVHAQTAIDLIRAAIELSSQELDDLDAIRELGQGWVAEETLAIAVYCCLKHEGDFEGCVIAAVNHSGDSDSTGAVAGNIMGAVVGENGIPKHFSKPLELRELTVRLALALCGDGKA